MSPYPKLTSNMKMTLVNNVNQTKYEDYIVHYHVEGDVRFPDEFPAALPDTVARINAKIDAILNVPDPEEQDEWERILALTANGLPASIRDLEKLISMVESYIHRWSSARHNHIEEAQGLLTSLKKALEDAGREGEQREWDAVNKFDYDAIIDYLKRHPHTPFLEEADGYLWDIARGTKPLKRSLNKYISDAKRFGLSHVADAQEMLNEYDRWRALEERAIWRDVLSYIQDYPDSPFKDEAQDLLERLAEKELDKMRKNPAPYHAEDCRDLVENDLISKRTLIGENLITEESYRKMMRREIFVKNNTIPDPKGNYFDDSWNENITDIFLFGIPGTGKTCVLMGLLNSDRFQFNPVIADGEYGEVLQTYVSNGFMAPQTLGGFVSICTGTVRDSKGIEHAVNIIDMAGEDFAMKIARNPEGAVAFEDMGHSAAQLLNSKHRKFFFVVIDPTSDKVTLQREAYDYDDEGNRIGIRDAIDIPIYQNQTLNRLVHLFSDPSNASVMKRVDGIHFLMTKADTLDPEGDGLETREANGIKKINNRNYKAVVEHVKRLCDKDNFDLPVPKLFLFSLGTCYVGKVFEPELSDADAILDMIAGGSVGVARNTVMDKIISFWSKPLF